MHSPRSRSSCRSARRSAPRSSRHDTDKKEPSRNCKTGAGLCCTGTKISRAVQTETGCDRRIVGNREISARAGIGASAFAVARRGGAAQRCRAQDVVRHRRNRKAAGAGLLGRDHDQGLQGAYGKSAAHNCRRLFGHRRCVSSLYRSSGPRLQNQQTAPSSTDCSSSQVSRPRLTRVGNRGRDASDADADVARKQEEFDLGRVAWSKVDASGTPEETLLRAEGMLKLR